MVKSPLIRVVLALVLSAALVPDALDAANKKPDILGFRGRPKKRSTSRSRSPGRFPESERRYDPEQNVADLGNGEGAGDNQIDIGNPSPLSTIREYRDEELEARSDNDLGRELFGSSNESDEFYVQESVDQQQYNQDNQTLGQHSEQQIVRDDRDTAHVVQTSLPAAPDNSSNLKTTSDTSSSSVSLSSSSSSSSSSPTSTPPPTIVVSGTTEITVSTEQNHQPNQPESHQQQGEQPSSQDQQNVSGEGTQQKSQNIVEAALGQDVASGIPAITQFYRCFNEFRTTKYWYWLKVTCGVGAAVWLFYYAWMTYGAQIADGTYYYGGTLCTTARETVTAAYSTAGQYVQESVVPAANSASNAIISAWQGYVAEPVSNAYSMGKDACLTYLVAPIIPYIQKYFAQPYVRYNPYCEPPYANVQSVNGSIPLGACNPNDQTEYFLSGHCSEGAERIAFFH